MRAVLASGDRVVVRLRKGLEPVRGNHVTPPRRDSLVSVQRQLGNRRFEDLGAGVLQRSCACGGHCAECASRDEDTLPLQRSLTVGPADDVAEREADHVADWVMRTADRVAPRPTVGDRDLVRAKPSCHALVAGPATPSAAREVLGRSSHSLDAATRAFMEPRFGVDLGDVRVHTGPQAAEAARSVQARAYTVGNHLVFGTGEYEPGSDLGRRLLAHELTHVLQQRTQLSEPKDPGVAPGTPVQRARLPCSSHKKVTVYTVNLPGAGRSIADDLKNGNDVLCQCGIELVDAGGESWVTTLMDRTPPAGVLNEYTVSGTPTGEESELLAHQPGGTGAVHVYYVPSLSSGSRGESFAASQFPLVTNHAVVISDAAAVDTFAHELGHVLLDDGGHHGNADNLMAQGGSRRLGVDELEESQCSRM